MNTINKKFDVIIMIESNFQKRIVDFMKNTLFEDKKILLIDARPGHFIIDGVDYGFNVSKSNNKSKFPFIHSLINSLHLPFLETELFVFPYPSCNFFIIEKYIKCKNKAMFDDGIGTVVILKKPDELLLRMKLRWCVKKILYWLFGMNLRLDTAVINECCEYYSIYKDVQVSEKIRINIHYMNYWSSYNFQRCEENVGFIGIPLTFPKEIYFSLERFYKSIEAIYGFYQKPIAYYPHPREDIRQLEPVASCLDIKSYSSTVEDYFRTHSVPQILISPFSTVLLNLKLANIPNLKLFYIDIVNKKTPQMKYCYEIFRRQQIFEWISSPNSLKELTIRNENSF